MLVCIGFAMHLRIIIIINGRDSVAKTIHKHFQKALISK